MTTEASKNILNEYREYLEQTGKSANTVKAYIHDVTSFASWLELTTGEVFELQTVDPREITDYRGFMLQRDSKPATVNRRLIALRRFFRWAIRDGHATSSPFEILENVHVKEQKDVAPRWLSRKDQLALLRAIRRSENLRNLALIQMMLGTGLRISEVAALMVSDVKIGERS